MFRYYFRLWLWCNLWFILWLLALPFKKKGYDNCLTYALKRLAKEPGYLVIRWARSAKYKAIVWPHFMFLPEADHQKVQHLVPNVEHRARTKLPVIWFDGKEKTGDPIEHFDDEDTEPKK